MIYRIITIRSCLWLKNRFLFILLSCQKKRYLYSNQDLQLKWKYIFKKQWVDQYIIYIAYPKLVHKLFLSHYTQVKFFWKQYWWFRKKSSLRWKPESSNSVTNWKNWIPAFAGMTKNGVFRLFTSSSIFVTKILINSSVYCKISSNSSGFLMNADLVKWLNGWVVKWLLILESISFAWKLDTRRIQEFRDLGIEIWIFSLS